MLLLADRTSSQLGVDLFTLKFDSNQIVYVKCEHCSEELLREYRNRNEPHQCPTFISRQGTILRHCPSCYTYLALTCFGDDALCHHCQLDRSKCEQSKYNGPFRFEYQKVNHDAKLPFRKRTTDAGYDLASIENVIIPPHGTVNIHTGLKIACPPGTYFSIEGRSSMWTKGVTPYRGIIDAGYNGDLMITLMNISDTQYEISKGDRVAQLIAHRQYDIDFIHVDQFSPYYNIRGTAGFGSSGK